MNIYKTLLLIFIGNLYSGYNVIGQKLYTVIKNTSINRDKKSCLYYLHSVVICNDTIFKVSKNIYAVGEGKDKRYREYRFVNSKGNNISRQDYNIIDFSFTNGFMPVARPGGVGVIDTTLTEVVSCRYNGAAIEGGLITIETGGGAGLDYQPPRNEYQLYGENPFHSHTNYMNRKLEWLIPNYYDSMPPYKPGRIWLTVRNNKYGFLDTTGKEAIAPMLQDTDNEDNYMWQYLRRVQFNNKYGFIDDRTGKIIIPFDYEATVASNYPFTWLKKGGKWGCVAQNGQVRIPFRYDAVSYFDKDTIAIVSADGHYGFINGRGRLLTPIMYDYVWPFSDGMAVVKTGDLFSYVNSRGKPLIPVEYDSATPFVKGLATVRKNGIIVRINHNGEWVSWRLGTNWQLGIFAIMLLAAGYFLFYTNRKKQVLS